MQEPYVIRISDLIALDIPITSRDQQKDQSGELVRLLRQTIYNDTSSFHSSLKVADANRHMLICTMFTIIDIQHSKIGSNYDEELDVCRFFIKVSIVDLTLGIDTIDGEDARRMAHDWIAWELFNNDDFHRSFFLSDSGPFWVAYPPLPLSIR